MIVLIVLRLTQEWSAANNNAQNASKRIATQQKNARNATNMENNAVSVDLNVKSVKNNASHAFKKIEE